MTDAERQFLQMLSRETPERTADFIARLDRWLSAHRPDYYRRLQPGVTDAELDRFQADFGLTLPASFRTFYRWRNGQEPGCSASLQDNFMLMPLEEIRGTKHLLDGMIGYDFQDPNWWRREWVPFLHDGAGDHLCLDLAPAAEGVAPPVRRFWHDLPDRPCPHLSFEIWIGVLVASMEGGRSTTD